MVSEGEVGIGDDRGDDAELPSTETETGAEDADAGRCFVDEVERTFVASLLLLVVAALGGVEGRVGGELGVVVHFAAPVGVSVTNSRFVEVSYFGYALVSI
jgi:hypothetical protein